MYKELIITSKKARVRKSCYPCILRVRHQFSDSALSVKANTRVLTVRRYLQRANMITSLRQFLYKYQIHEHRVKARIGSATPPAGQVPLKSYFKLSTNCTNVVIRQVKIIIIIIIIIVVIIIIKYSIIIIIIIVIIVFQLKQWICPGSILLAKIHNCRKRNNWEKIICENHLQISQKSQE